MITVVLASMLELEPAVDEAPEPDFESPIASEPDGRAPLGTAAGLSVLNTIGYLGSHFAAERCTGSLTCGFGHWYFLLPHSVAASFAVVPTLVGIGSRQLAQARHGASAAKLQRRWHAMRAAGGALYLVSLGSTIASYVFAYDFECTTASGRVLAMVGTQVGARGQAAGVGMFSYGHNRLRALRPMLSISPMATTTGVMVG